METEYTPERQKEIKNRIKVALAAAAYEIYDDPIITDAEFDKLAREIDLTIETDRPDLDKWFKDNFSSSTGMWIYKHPELNRIKGILESVYRLR